MYAGLAKGTYEADQIQRQLQDTKEGDWFKAGHSKMQDVCIVYAMYAAVI